jgi:rhomboid family GlyGly-CTERM serine protease
VQAFEYDRTDIGGGEFWRLWTGHVTHFGWSHLAWNLAVFVPAGIWLERKRPIAARWFLAIAPVAISGALWMTDAALERYAGLSGVATGLLVFLALLERGEPKGGARFWNLALILVAAKIALELATQNSLFVHFGHPEIRSVPAAHVAGAAIGGFAYWLTRLMR